MTPKPHKKTPKLVPEASKRHPKLSLLPPQNTLWAPHVDEPEKNTKSVPKETLQIRKTKVFVQEGLQFSLFPGTPNYPCEIPTTLFLR